MRQGSALRWAPEKTAGGRRQERECSEPGGTRLQSRVRLGRTPTPRGKETDDLRKLLKKLEPAETQTQDLRVEAGAQKLRQKLKPVGTLTQELRDRDGAQKLRQTQQHDETQTQDLRVEAGAQKLRQKLQLDETQTRS